MNSCAASEKYSVLTLKGPKEDSMKKNKFSGFVIKKKVTSN